MKYIRVIINCTIVGFVALVLQGILHRDPHVALPHGYAIVATYWGAPCFLVYEQWNDDRPYSDWTAMRSDMTEDSGKQSTIFTLHNNATNEVIFYDTEPEWEAARCKKNAAPPGIKMGAVSGITGFGVKDAFAFGACDKGYFLLDAKADSFETYNDMDQWQQQVVEKTGGAPGALKDPKAWRVQTRHSSVNIIVVVFVLIALPWAFRPLWSSRGRPPSVHEGV